LTVLSFHPCFVADQNRLCAGRDPDDTDLAAIQAADAVVLPQGCSKRLYELAYENCSNVFPNFTARFDYPGKLGQIELFRQTGTAHPETFGFSSLRHFQSRFGRTGLPPPFDFPFVFKFDWGGEGEMVFAVRSSEDFQAILQKVRCFEKTGQYGFMLQEFVACRNRTLRAVVIGRRIRTYWRVQKQPQRFLANLSAGATIEMDTDSELQQAAVESVRRFMDVSGINLAGFDLIFSEDCRHATPLFLEINYFFGRRGLGGSQNFYILLESEIERWLKSIGLKVKPRADS